MKLKIHIESTLLEIVEALKGTGKLGQSTVRESFFLCFFV